MNTLVYIYFVLHQKIPIRNFVLLWPRRKKIFRRRTEKTKKTERQKDRFYFEEIILEI